MIKKRCLLWLLSGVMLFLMLSGCDSTHSLDLDFEGASYETTNYEVFKGTLNNQPESFRVPDFACDPNGFYVYSDLPEARIVGTGLNYRIDEVSLGVLIITLLNADDTQVDCGVESFPRADVVKVNDSVIRL